MSQELIQSTSSEFSVSELSEGNFAERKIEGTNPLNPETAVKSKTRKPRKMSQIVAQELVAEVAVVPAKKLSIKMKKMMMSEIPVIPEKIETDSPQSAGGSVNQQASQMSQEFNQYGSIEMNWFNAVGEESVVAEEVPAPVVPEVKKIKTIRPRVKKVSVAPAPEVPVAVVQDVAEILAEIVENAYEEAQLKEEVAREKAEKRRLITEKAKATREANKAKKLAPVAVAEEEEEKDAEYEESTPTRPIQKSKEGRVLAGKVVAVEKKMKKELKVLKTPLKELLSKYKTEEKIEEKREEFIEAKKEAISAIHQAIAQEFKTSIVVARRSETGKGEKKTLSSRGVQLKDTTVQNLFWANCLRVLPHFVADFVSYASAKKIYTQLYTDASIEEKPADLEKAKEARTKLNLIFQRASEALVADDCLLFAYECGDEAPLSYHAEGKRKILATHLSLQGIYVVKRVSNKNPLVLRSSRDELIEIGNTNEVMSEKDLIFHADTGVDRIGKGVLKKICGVSEMNLAKQGKAYQEGEDKVVEACD